MKRQIQNYSFAPGGAGAGTVTFTNMSSISLDRLLIIANATRGTIIYNFADSTLGGTAATNVLTLATSTSGHSSGDKLVIYYDDDDLNYDTGGGTKLRPAMGLIVPGSGGPVAVPGDGTNGLKVNVTNASVTVSATVASALPSGSNTIGKVDIASALPAGSATIGNVGNVAGSATIGGVTLDSTSLQVGGAAVAPKFAAITASASGNTSVVAAVTGKKIRVISVWVVANAAVNVKFQSATTDKTGLAYLAVNGGFVLPFSPVGHFETASGEALNINLSAAVAVGGSVTYVEV